MTKINEILSGIKFSNANIFYLLEMKKESFDLGFIRKIAPKRFDNFDFYPSLGASGGILVCWASNHFSTITLEKKNFAITLAITSLHYKVEWNLVIVYGPYRQPARDNFVNWVFNLHIDEDDLYHLGLIELPPKSHRPALL